jgi:hypothetical protein
VPELAPDDQQRHTPRAAFRRRERGGADEAQSDGAPQLERPRDAAGSGRRRAPIADRRSGLEGRRTTRPPGAWRVAAAMASAAPRPSGPSRPHAACRLCLAGSGSRGVHHGDDLLDRRRVGRVALALVARRATLVEARHGRGRSTSTARVELTGGWHASSLGRWLTRRSSRSPKPGSPVWFSAGALCICTGGGL